MLAGAWTYEDDPQLVAGEVRYVGDVQIGEVDTWIFHTGGAFSDDRQPLLDLAIGDTVEIVQSVTRHQTVTVTAASTISGNILTVTGTGDRGLSNQIPADGATVTITLTPGPIEGVDKTARALATQNERTIAGHTTQLESLVRSFVGATFTGGVITFTRANGATTTLNVGGGGGGTADGGQTLTQFWAGALTASITNLVIDDNDFEDLVTVWNSGTYHAVLLEISATDGNIVNRTSAVFPLRGQLDALIYRLRQPIDHIPDGDPEHAYLTFDNTAAKNLQLQLGGAPPTAATGILSWVS